ncbi:bacterial proteasome activator family protein [Nocardioides zeae]|uniref:Bacterial proteasome activator n=1 Tax=Nocardioides imazamoxiresistens TaxID=3231893 RepID=A0ABU3PVG1_9ACTN|nr:bacterial proteasome activator family protein [Nocardioides zeae]MDT9593231.1 bacterial proteasome activator family protein [Nocardioides zeae]
MSETPEEQQSATRPGPAGRNGAEEHVVIIGPDGQPVAAVPASALAQTGDQDDEGETSPRDLVEQPAKVMRIGSMIRQLLEEVKAAPLDEASRNRLKEIHQSSIKELEAGLAPELVEELQRLSLPFAEGTPSESELRIAQAQLVGWLEGLFHGIQTAIYAQQMAARAQLEQIRRALPGGQQGQPGQPGQPAPGQPGFPGAPGQGAQRSGESGGMYL